MLQGEDQKRQVDGGVAHGQYCEPYYYIHPGRDEACIINMQICTRIHVHVRMLLYIIMHVSWSMSDDISVIIASYPHHLQDCRVNKMK